MKAALPLGIGLGAGLLLLASRAKATPPEPPEPRKRPARPVRTNLVEEDPATPSGMPTQKDLIQAAVRGTLELVWLPLPSAPGWEVTADAVKFDGVRWPVTARTAQHIADVLGARLTTPVLEDLIQSDATAQVVSPTQDYRVMQTLETIQAFNVELDQQLEVAQAARNELVSAVGKSWVLTTELESKPAGTACNYGMFRPDGRYLSITTRYKVWQQPGYRHNLDHWDYSQVLRLCRPTRQGLVVPSHDGVTLTRQPDVPLETAAIALET